MKAEYSFTKILVKSGLKLLGLEIHRTMVVSPVPELHRRMNTLRTTMGEVLEHAIMLGLSPATVIDVGVANGTPALYEKFPNAFHLLVEPLAEFEPDLKRICSQVKAAYVLAAASASPGKMNITVSRDLFGSSLLNREGEVREVSIITLDDVCRERQLQGPYVIKVDVQGAELQVLDGASHILRVTELIILEVSFFQFHDNCPEFYDVIHYMKEHGFVPYDIFSGHNRPLDGARAQVDIAFVKENGLFRSSHTWATVEQETEIFA